MTDQVQKFFTPHDKYQLAYTEWGDSNNPKTLICVHGYSRNGRDFDYLARELSKYYRVICLDMVGRGKSDWVDPKFYNYDNYAEDVIALTEHLSVKNVDYIGTSMGGLISFIVSTIKPNLINKLVLNDIGPKIPTEALEKMFKYVSVYPTFSNLEHAERHIRTKLAHFGISKDEDWKYITKTSTTTNNKGELILAYDKLINTARRDPRVYDSEGIFKQFDFSEVWNTAEFNKLLILRGTTSEIFPKQMAEEMLNSKEDSFLIEFENIGHAPALMDHHQIETIRNWLLH